jgi:hypothetical protein
MEVHMASVGPFITITARNSGPDIISFTVKAAMEDAQLKFDWGNFGSGKSYIVQLPATVTSIQVTINREAFIGDWKGVVSDTWTDATGWTGQNCSYSVSDGSSTRTFSS